MNKHETAELLANAIIKQQYKVTKNKRQDGEEFGIKTKQLIEVTYHFTLQKPIDRTIFSNVCEWFPSSKGQRIKAGHLSYQNAELTINVYFPLPFKSAEYFPSEYRSEFISNMGSHLIAERINHYLHGNFLNTFKEVTKDPRHPNELRWRRFRSRIRVFLKNVFGEKPKVHKSKYDDYF